MMALDLIRAHDNKKRNVACHNGTDSGDAKEFTRSSDTAITYTYQAFNQFSTDEIFLSVI
jgi:cytochrome c peroxidase